MSLDEDLYDRWKMQEFDTCDQYDGSNIPERVGINFIGNMKKQINYLEGPYDHLVLTDSRNFMKFTMQINLIRIDNNNRIATIPFGRWNSEYDREIQIEREGVLQDFLTTNVLKVVVVEQKPFVFVDKLHPRGFNGFCIDMMESIANIMNINFTLELASDNKFGDLDENGSWNGVIKDLLDRKADIGLGTMRASASRQLVIDFTVPYYEPVGFILLMKSFRSKPSFIKFIHVLDAGVWVVSLIALAISSALIWVFDKYSPKSYSFVRGSGNKLYFRGIYLKLNEAIFLFSHIPLIKNTTY
ncbi:hypothetical protein WA026_015657 [Henosepilachna vigintioctopunctata]|uniref:Uncharacterized protein n=1 Tax=Henosepilachna vigintioctopunctata TaxID=420089 RepID=A0AAW1VHG2_9CUCU